MDRADHFFIPSALAYIQYEIQNLVLNIICIFFLKDNIYFIPSFYYFYKYLRAVNTHNIDSPYFPSTAVRGGLS